MELRRATLADSAHLLAWRNDKLTRENSSTLDLISQIDHEKWLNKALLDENLVLYVAYDHNNLAIGTIRSEYEHQNKIYKVSWTVGPPFRKKGNGKRMGLLFVEKFSERIRVEIKANDRYSVSIAIAMGLKFVQEKEGILHYSL